MRDRETCASVIWVVLGLLWSPCVAAADQDAVGFSSDQWVLANAEVTEHMGREALTGFAYLKDVEFEDGVIEMDVIAAVRRCYPGVLFRMQSQENSERLYIRPHRAGLYPDAVQYTPVINGIAGWQLYNGDGFTAEAEIPTGEWVHLRIEVKGTQGRVFLGDADRPALVIHDLKHGVSRGTIGILTEPRGGAYIADFRYRADDTLEFDPPPPVETPPGTILDWQVSQVFPASDIDFEVYPDRSSVGEIEWKAVRAEPSGLVDFARHVTPTRGRPDCVLARTLLPSDEEKTLEFRFGYSDVVSVFFNGRLLFNANSGYQSRDPSFLGVIGLNDIVYLPLGQGENEVLMMVAESFGGWGIMAQDGDAVFEAAGVEKAWETDRSFRMPESVVYDPERRVAYVSNYDGFTRSGPEGLQFISTVGLDGVVKDPEWASGLRNPTGMAVWKRTLYVVERGGLVEIDTGSGEVRERRAIPGARFPNDVAVDKRGRLYISDSARSVIYRFADGRFEEWLAGGDIQDPNGLVVDGDRLIVGANGDQSLKAVDLKTQEVTRIARLGSGVIDGLSLDRNGNYLVSHWQGRIYRVTPRGEVTRLLDTSVVGAYSADFGYAPEERLILIPTFYGDRVSAYRIP